MSEKIPGTDPNWNVELPDGDANSLVDKHGRNHDDGFNFDEKDNSENERKIGAASLIGYGENDGKEQGSEEEREKQGKVLGYDEVCELYPDIKIYENERDYCIPDFSKYGAKMTYMIPKNFQFKIDEYGEIENPLSTRWKNEFEARKVDSRRGAGLIYGDFWMSRNGKPCFRITEDSDKASHAMIKTDWHYTDGYDLSYLPSIKNSGLVYFHRVKSNSGKTGSDYLVVPTKFLETGDGGLVECEEQCSRGEYNPQKDRVVADALTYFDGELICKEADKVVESGKEATEAVLRYLEDRTRELDPARPKYYRSDIGETGVPEIDEILIKNLERDKRAFEINGIVREGIIEPCGMEYYKQVLGRGNSLSNIKDKLLFPSIEIDEDWLNKTKNYNEAIDKLPKRKLDIDSTEKLPEVEEYHLNVDVPEGKSPILYGTYAVGEGDSGSLSDIHGCVEYDDVHVDEDGWYVSYEDNFNVDRYLFNVWFDNLEAAQRVMNESNGFLADFIEEKNNLKRAFEDEEARERGEKGVDGERASRVRRHLDDMMESPVPVSGLGEEIAKMHSYWINRIKQPIENDFRDGCDFNMALREVFDKKYPVFVYLY